MQPQTPEDDSNTRRLREPRFARRTKRGFWIAAIAALAVDVSLLATLGATSDAAIKAWWSVNFMSFPCVWGCVAFAGPRIGESQSTSWGYAVVAVSIVVSCLCWGIAGAGIAKLTKKRSAQ